MKDNLEKLIKGKFYQSIPEDTNKYEKITKHNSMFNYLPIGYEYHTLKKQKQMYFTEMMMNE